MKRTLILLGASLLLLASSGCASVTSGMPTTSTVTGEAWYVKTTSFIGLPVATHVYFCPKPMGKGPAKCTEALIHEAVEAPAAAAAAAWPESTPQTPQQPTGYGAPQQPAPGGYGVPQQPAPGGYGVPQQPAPGGYGVPQQPTYTPPASGYQQPSTPPQPPAPGY